MANKTIPNLPDYGSQDTDKIKKDLLEITKNDGTYASPSYPTGASRKITLEEFKTALAIETSFIKDIVFKYDVDTVLEIGKINWVAPTADHTMSVPTADVGNLGEILIVNNRSVFELTITGVVVTPLILNGVNSIVGLVCVTNGVSYGWEVFSRYNIGDFDLISQTITNGVTDKAPSEDAVFDALALKSNIASPTFTGTVTTPDVIVSGATADTIAHFDATKNAKSLPTATYPNLTELSYVKGVTSAIQTQINAKSTAYAIPNYYRVDLNLGDDATGVAGREDKPYRFPQTVWDLIPTSSTAQITIEIVGDFTFTIPAIISTTAKSNVTFLFKGIPTNSIIPTSTSYPLFTFISGNNNITIIIDQYVQTTNGGLISSGGDSTKVVIGTSTRKQGINITTKNSYGIYLNGTKSQLSIGVDNIDITNDTSIVPYANLINCTTNISLEIGEVYVTGSSSQTNSLVYLTGTYLTATIKYQNWNITYTNVNQLSICSIFAADVLNCNSIAITSNGSTIKGAGFALFFSTTINILNIEKASLLNYSYMFRYSGATYLNIKNLILNGAITYDNSACSKVFNFGTITIPSIVTENVYHLNGGNSIKGDLITYAEPSVNYSTLAIILCYSNSSKVSNIKIGIVYNSAMVTGSVPAFIPIRYYATGSVIRFNNTKFSSNLDTNSHASTTFIRAYGDNPAYTARIEGNVSTNYLQNVTNLTNDADIDLINGYTL